MVAGKEFPHFAIRVRFKVKEQKEELQSFGHAVENVDQGVCTNYKIMHEPSTIA